MELDEKDEFDFILKDSLKNKKLPFLVRKIQKDVTDGGNYYLFGTMIILMRTNRDSLSDSTQYIVEVYKSGESLKLHEFLDKHLKSEFDSVKAAVKSSTRTFNEGEDPVKIVCEKAEADFRKEKNY